METMCLNILRLRHNTANHILTKRTNRQQQNLMLRKRLLKIPGVYELGLFGRI